MKPLAIPRFAVTDSRSPLVSECGACLCRIWRHGGLLLAALAVVAATQPGSAATNYWDTATNANLQAGSGTWDSGITPMWSATTAGSNPLLAWTDDNDAFFQTGVTGILNTPTISGTVRARSVCVNNAGSSTIISNGTLVLGVGGLVNNSNTNPLTIHAALTLTTNVTFGAGNTSTITVDGPIGESGGLPRKVSMSGNVSLLGTNSFTGGIRVSAGGSTYPSILTINSTGALGSCSAQVELDANGVGRPSTVLQMNLPADNTITNPLLIAPNASPVVFASGGAGAVTLSNKVSYNTAGIPQTFAYGGTSTAANKMLNGLANNGTGIVSVIKQDAGAWTLAGANNYTGTTTVAAGTLWMNGTLHSNSAVTVSNNATLGGSGTISGSVAVVSGGILSPGAAGIGTLAIKGGLNLGESATYSWEYGASGADRIAVGGALQLPSVATVNVVQVSGTLPKPAVLFTAGSLSGAPTGWVVKGLPYFTVGIQNGTNVVLRSSAGTVMLYM